MLVQKRQNYGSALILVLVNIIMYLAQRTFQNFNFTETLLLVPSDIFVKPYILISSMFLHGGFGHLFFNMYALFMFGSLIESRVGTKRFLSMYFLSGIIAGIIYALFSLFILGTNTPALGASGAIMAVLGLTIMLLPELKVLFFFIIPMSLRTAGIIFVAIDIFGLFVPTGIAHIAHLAGLGCGLIFGYLLLKEKNKFVQKFTTPKKQVSKNKFNNNSHNEIIELSDEDIEVYLKNGRL